MGKNMSLMKNEIVVLLLAVLAILLVAVAIFQPWWSARTSPELQIMSNFTLTIDASLFQTLSAVKTDANTTSTLTFAITNDTAYQDPIFQTITANRTDGNLTSLFTFSISNMTSYQHQTEQIAVLTNTTLPLTVAGLVLAIITMLLILVVTRTKMALERYTYVVGVLAAIVLLITPLHLALNVASFWGSLNIPDSNPVWKNEVLAVWGPSIGWFLTLAAALLIIVCLLPVRMRYSDRKRGIQSLK
jgi:hypothetical protein